MIAIELSQSLIILFLRDFIGMMGSVSFVFRPGWCAYTFGVVEVGRRAPSM